MKTNNTQDDYSAIHDLCHTVGTVSDANFQCELEAIFDVDGFLRLAAVEILVGHWDNYIGNQNNFYLYERPSDGRLMMFSYDVDNTCGIEWGRGRWPKCLRLGPMGNQTPVRPHDGCGTIQNAPRLVHPRLD